MKQFLALLVIAMMSLGFFDTASGGRTVELRAQDVSVREADREDVGPHFVLDIDIPGGVTGEVLLGAILEFVVNADTRVDTTWIEEADTLKAFVHSTPVPLVEVYALTSRGGSALNTENWNQAMSFPVPVGVGSEKIVRINITRLVKYLIENPEANHGLVVGSLTGDRFGLFTLQEHFGDGVKARIRYVY